MAIPKEPRPEITIHWLDPAKTIVDFRYSVIHYEIVDHEGEVKRNIDVFMFSPLGGVFRSNNGHITIKYRDILKWFPLPDID